MTTFSTNVKTNDISSITGELVASSQVSFTLAPHWGTSPFGGSYWEVIIPTVWGQTLYSTNSASQNPVIAYYLFTNNTITLTMGGGYLIQYSTNSFSNGIVLYGLGSVC